MSNMTPFEIRLELLKMAKDMLVEEYFGKREQISNEWNLKADVAKIHCSEINEDWRIKVEVAKLNGGEIPSHPGYSAYPSEKDIITKAQELNGFVSNIETKPIITKKAATQNAA